MSRRLCFALDLVNDAQKIAEYEQFHRPGRVWPQIADDIHAQGIEGMEIWRTGDRMVMIATVADDYPRARDIPAQYDEWEGAKSTDRRCDCEKSGATACMAMAHRPMSGRSASRVFQPQAKVASWTAGVLARAFHVYAEARSAKTRARRPPSSLRHEAKPADASDWWGTIESVNTPPAFQ